MGGGDGTDGGVREEDLKWEVAGMGVLPIICSVQKESVIIYIMTTEFIKRNGSDYWRRGMRLQSCLRWGEGAGWGVEQGMCQNLCEGMSSLKKNFYITE